MCWKSPIHDCLTCSASINQTSVQISAHPVPPQMREHSRKSVISLQRQTINDFLNHWTLFLSTDIYTNRCMAFSFLCLPSSGNITYKIQSLFLPEVVPSHCCIVLHTITISWLIFKLSFQRCLFGKTVLVPSWGWGYFRVRVGMFECDEL